MGRSPGDRLPYQLTRLPATLYRLIGSPSGLSDSGIGSISNQWQRLRRKKFS